MDKSFEFDYNAWAAEQALDKERRSQLVRKAEMLFDIIPAGAEFENALEIGCAEGIVINRLRELLHIKQCYGLDASTTFVELGRSLYPEIEFIHTSDINIPFPDSSIDLIVLSDIIEHIGNVDLFLAEVKRVGKAVLLKVPLDKYLWRKMISEPLGRSHSVGPKHPDGHLHEFSKKSCERIFKKMNFSVLNSKIIYLPADYEEKKFPIRLRWLLDERVKEIMPNVAHKIFGGVLLTFFSTVPAGKRRDDSK
jgi:ubiquinone/menaquinone biosynthesis C-methylase UbiE